MKLLMSLVAIMFATAMGTIPAVYAQDAPTVMTSDIDIKMSMRTLWQEHIVYTRNYIISALADLPDKDAVTTRLLKNQDDIGEIFKPHFGHDMGRQLSALLRDHIQIATEVVMAAKVGSQAQLDAAQIKWTANGREIAALLNRVNPNWRLGELESMLQKHLDLTTAEVKARVLKDWIKDIEAFDEGHLHMLMFADMLSAGIANPFPATPQP